MACHIQIIRNVMPARAQTNLQITLVRQILCQHGHQLLAATILNIILDDLQTTDLICSHNCFITCQKISEINKPAATELN